MYEVPKPAEDESLASQNALASNTASPEKLISVEGEVPSLLEAVIHDPDDPMTTQPPEPRPTRGPRKGPRFHAAFIGLCVSALAVALDTTSLAVAIPVSARVAHGEIFN
jgi:hypothetical protein